MKLLSFLPTFHPAIDERPAPHRSMRIDPAPRRRAVAHHRRGRGSGPRLFAVEAARRGWNLILTDIAPLAKPRVVRVDDVRRRGVDRARRSRYQRDAEPAVRRAPSGRRRNRRARERGRRRPRGLVHRPRSRRPPRHRQGERGGDGRQLTREILARRNRTQRFVLINACSLAAATPMPFKATYRGVEALRARLLPRVTRGARRRRLRHRALPRRPADDAAPRSGASSRRASSDVSPRSAPDRRRLPRADAAEAEPRICVPGVFSRGLYGLAGAVPTWLAVQAVGRRWPHAATTSSDSPKRRSITLALEDVPRGSLRCSVERR